MLSSAELQQHLASILNQPAAAHTITGIAAVLNDPPHLIHTWTPTTLPTEPVFLAYSITKTFTATLALLLQEHGRLSLNTPLAQRRRPRLQSQRLSPTHPKHH